RGADAARGGARPPPRRIGWDRSVGADARDAVNGVPRPAIVPVVADDAVAARRTPRRQRGVAGARLRAGERVVTVGEPGPIILESTESPLPPQFPPAHQGIPAKLADDKQTGQPA